MRISCLLILTGLYSMAVNADSTEAHGVWSTQHSEGEGYIEVTIAPCDADASLTCGTITRAYDESGDDPNYEHLGKLIIEDMKYHKGKYSGGTIWDPQSGKTYKSKMQRESETDLDVDGCISFMCQSEHWQLVNN